MIDIDAEKANIVVRLKNTITKCEKELAEYRRWIWEYENIEGFKQLPGNQAAIEKTRAAIDTIGEIVNWCKNTIKELEATKCHDTANGKR